MIRRNIVFLGIALLSVISTITVACTSEEAGQFEDIKWTLESYGISGNPEPVLAGTNVTATFKSDETQVSGSAGCNSYSGEYQVNGDEITVGQIASTEMYCMDPEGVMDQETEYLKLLMKAGSYEVIDGELHINCDGKILIFN